MRTLLAALAVRAAAAAWSDGAVAPQDCDALSGVPLQVLMYGNNDAYTLRKLDQGEWEKLFKINWFDGHINAAAVFVDENNDVYFFASFGGYLCRFDEDQKVCFDGQLKYSSPNAGVIVGATFYYSKNLGRDGGETIHFVTDIGSDSPTQVTSDKVAFSSSLFEGAVLDFAAVDEADGVSYVEDGDDDLAYLLGLGADFEVVVIRLDNDGHPDAYAVLEGTVEWGAGEEGESGGFGAAYMFKSDGDDAVTSVFFSSNGGKGTFGLDLGFAVDDDCWNEGTDTSGHTKCTSSQPIVRYEAASEESSSNDGLNCPFGVLGTDAPTALPTTSSPSYAPTVEKTEEPTPRPTHDPTKAPKPRPTAAPTYQPSVDPTIEPTEMPTYEPSKAPTPKPSPAPTSRPSANPSYSPTVDPTFEPTHEPSYEPTVSPTPGPSHAPSYSPTVDPTFEPTVYPTYEPSTSPTPKPSPAPTSRPSPEPSYAPTVDPTFEPTVYPTYEPSTSPTPRPSDAPSYSPTVDPTFEPTHLPTYEPSAGPSPRPTPQPSSKPTAAPSYAPSVDPTFEPTLAPTYEPTLKPSDRPTVAPSYGPSAPPSIGPSAEPTYAPTFSETHEPTLKPSMEPSAAPSWQPFIIDSVNCDPNKAAPLQVLRWEDADEYSLRSWDFQTGEYKKEYNIDYFDGHVNAVAMWERADGNNYAIGSFGGNLSWFSKKKRIDIGSLVYDTPNAGTVIGNDYYYARSPGKDERNCGIYFVEDIAGEPRFETTSNLCISKSVFEGAVLDFVAANEDDADRYGTSSTYVDDNEAEGLYLFGLGEQHEVLIVKLVDKMPQAYAVVSSVIDWRSKEDDDEPSDDSGYGAGYSFLGPTEQRFFFTSNKGFGMFELQMPISVPDDCWNTGTNTDDHKECKDAPAATLTWMGASAVTNYNDGLNCPVTTVFGHISYAPTYVPSPMPSKSDRRLEAAEAGDGTSPHAHSSLKRRIRRSLRRGFF